MASGELLYRVEDNSLVDREFWARHVWRESKVKLLCMEKTPYIQNGKGKHPKEPHQCNSWFDVKCIFSSLHPHFTNGPDRELSDSRFQPRAFCLFHTYKTSKVDFPMPKKSLFSLRLRGQMAYTSLRSDEVNRDLFLIFCVLYTHIKTYRNDIADTKYYGLKAPFLTELPGSRNSVFPCIFESFFFFSRIRSGGMGNSGERKGG
jgi:hypothetical protein